jgi:hypothetical protein
MQRSEADAHCAEALVGKGQVDVSVLKHFRRQRRAARDRSSTAISLAQPLHSPSARAERVGAAHNDKSQGREGQ